MMDSLKGFMRQCLPPAALDAMHYLRQPLDTGFWGNYASYEAAQSASAGYDSELILDKAVKATLQVAKGEAVAERDTVIFDRPLYVYPLFAHLLRLYHILQRPVRVADFGGALGSTYFQFKSFVGDVAPVAQWRVIEQPHFVRMGEQLFKNESLQFVNALEDIEAPDMILLSSVLQYLPDPYGALERFLSYRPLTIVLDRTPYWGHQGDRITVQKVPKHIYEASYPCWLLDEAKIQKIFKDKYDCIYDAIGLEGEVVTRSNKCCFKDKIYWQPNLK